jgi:5-methylcytosine-specific restriction endonuclease McrA
MVDMKIHEAAEYVLEQNDTAMHEKEITDEIIRLNLYSFNTPNPAHVVGTEIYRKSVNCVDPLRKRGEVFRRVSPSTWDLASRIKYWWVNQNRTFELELKGGYLWSPQKSKNGSALFHWTNMTKVSPGDIIFSYAGQKIKAVSIVRSKAYDSDRPIEFSSDPWDRVGWKVDAEYTLLSKPIAKKLIKEKFSNQLTGTQKPLDKNGNGKQAYLFALNDEVGASILKLTELDSSSQDLEELSNIHTELLDSVNSITQQFSDKPDERRPGDTNRKGTFKNGWNYATRKGDYQSDTLSKITWQNLGYRIGKELGDLDKDSVDLIYNHLASTWDGEYFEPTDDEETLKNQAKEYLKYALVEDDDYEGPDGLPDQTKQTSNSFKRCPRVVAKVLHFANGTCELCLEAAPFNKSDGEPYLEVHHVVPLAEKGLDKTTNAVALCPNCHRRCHHSKDADAARSKLYDQVKRLIASEQATYCSIAMQKFKS